MRRMAVFTGGFSGNENVLGFVLLAVEGGEVGEYGGGENAARGWGGDWEGDAFGGDVVEACHACTSVAGAEPVSSTTS